MFQTAKPKWRRLYILVPLMIGLLVVEARAAIPPIAHEIAQLGIVLLTFDLMALWVRFNRIALMNETRSHKDQVQLPYPNEFASLDLNHSHATNEIEFAMSNLSELDASQTRGRYN